MQLSSDLFNKDISQYICNSHCDILSLVAFAETTKSNRVYVSQLITNQFSTLLDYMRKATDTHDYPSIQKRIYSICMKIQSTMSSIEFKDSPDLKSCINFKIFKQAFDLLKPFSREIHFKKEEVVNLNCPIFITEMLSPDSDEEIWYPLNSKINENDNINSVVKELKKLGLFEEGNLKDQTLRYVFGQKPTSFFTITTTFFNKLNQKTLHVGRFYEDSGFIATPLIFGQVSKWNIINSLYKRNFVDFSEGENRAIPLSDFKAEVSKKYLDIYTYAASQVRDADMEKLENGDYCLRYAKTKDCYENPYISLAYKVSNQLQEQRIPIESFSSTKEFDSFIESQLKDLA